LKNVYILRIRDEQIVERDEGHSASGVFSTKKEKKKKH
jgi:hypothetical protein